MMNFAKIILLLSLALFSASGISQNKQTSEMIQVLKNKNLEIQIDLPLENYNFSRFDWTGKIVAVRYKDVLVTGVEKMNEEHNNKIGKGLFNEFGIENPVAFDEAKANSFFHKIGVGLLKKEGTSYDFSKEYKIEPAEFTYTADSNKVIIQCKSQAINGYAYLLIKEIELFESSFVIRYLLKNTGEKIIETDEYCHNFMAFNKALVGSDYILRFPFQISPELFNATVNPEGKVEIGQHEITFNNTPEKQFFFSNLSGSKPVDAAWELINTKSRIGIRETGSFQTNKINLWGWKHVISPELFFDIRVKPGQTTKWSRTYKLFEIN